MAESPPNGVFWSVLSDAMRGVESVGLELSVDVAAHGPAGTSIVELPGGESVEVDHLDPARLIGASTAADEAAVSQLLVALFGGDGALHLADVAAAGGGASRLRLEPDEFGSWRGPRSGPPRSIDVLASRFGRLVLLADLARDPFALPLARVAASAELVADLRSVPGGDLFEPLAPDLASRTVDLFDQVSDAEVDDLEPEVAHALADLLEPLAASMGRRAKHGAVLRGWQQRLRSVEPELHVAAMAGAPVPRLRRDELDGEAWHADALEVADAVPDTGPQIVRRAPSLLEVTVQRSDRARWVRVLRTDGLVLLSLAPLAVDGLVDRSELLVPPDTATDELSVQVLDVDDLDALHDAPIETMRRAVRVGRAAASAERSRERWRAHARWQRCSQLWDEAGDARRSRMAEGRTGTGGGRLRIEPMLADEFDPYGIDADLEGVLEP